MYAQDIDWVKTVTDFNEAKAQADETAMNFLTRLRGLHITMVETCGRVQGAQVPHAVKTEEGFIAHAQTLLPRNMMVRFLQLRADDEAPPFESYGEFL